MMKFPQVLVLDFPDTLSATGLRNKIIQSDLVKSVKFAYASGKLRVMVSLKKTKEYSTKVIGNDVIVLFSDTKIAPKAVAIAKPPSVDEKSHAMMTSSVTKNDLRDANQNVTPLIGRKSVSHQAMASNYIKRPTPDSNIPAYHYEKEAKTTINRLGVIDFRRETNGDGKVIIPMPHANIKVDSNKKGNKVSLVLTNVGVEQEKRRLNVVDFATPASYIDITRQGANVRIDISAQASFEFSTQKEGRNLIVLMKKIR